MPHERHLRPKLPNITLHMITIGIKGINYQLTDGQSEPDPMTTPVGHYVHRMGYVFHRLFTLC
jgi:hypothetical protein